PRCVCACHSGMLRTDAPAGLSDESYIPLIAAMPEETATGSSAAGRTRTDDLRGSAGRSCVGLDSPTVERRPALVSSSTWVARPVWVRSPHRPDGCRTVALSSRAVHRALARPAQTPDCAR